MSVLIDIAAPCGLVLSELLSNALKHAFPDGRPGQIRVTLRRLDHDQLLLRVSDDGVGLPPGLDLQQSERLGLRIATSISEYQLRGALLQEAGPGVTWTLRFTQDHYQPRV